MKSSEKKTFQQSFREGLRAGLPIAMGYLPVSFAFGIMAVEGGMPLWGAMLISLTNLTSAGQFAGTQLILASASFAEIAASTFIINLRYMLMSLSLSQKADESMTPARRWITGFGVTDEIYAVAMLRDGPVGFAYMAGLITGPYIGWGTGTFLGAGANFLLPASVTTALGIALYAMFLAIIVPSSKKSKAVLGTVFAAAALSCLFAWVPFLQPLHGGWSVIICAVAVSAAAAWLKCRKAGNAEETDGGGGV